MKTRSVTWKIIATWLLSVAAPFLAKAQDKVEATVGADFVSSYIWRGQEAGGVSIQPRASIAYKGFTLGIWGSTGLDRADIKELDILLSYRTGGFSASVTDYWFNKTSSGAQAKYFHYGAHSNSGSHWFEAQIGYDFDLLTINWYTNFAGVDGTNKDGKRAYSSYFTAASPFTLGGLEWSTEIGIVPWRTNFYGTNGFAVCSIALGVSKDLHVGNCFTLPLFAKVTWSPRSESAYWVIGVSF